MAILREPEAGAKTEDVCRRHGVSTTRFYAWKAISSALDVSGSKRRKALENESTRLKRLLADAIHDNAALEERLPNAARAPASSPSHRDGGA